VRRPACTGWCRLDRHTIIHTNSWVLYAYGADLPRVYTNNISERP
jgi:hypothetical protein